MHWLRYFILGILCILQSFGIAQQVIVKNEKDKDNPRSYYNYDAGWEESVFLVPDGPCDVIELQVFLAGDKAGKDTIYITGDPGEGALPGTFFVLNYNQLADPVYIDYDGNPGWRKFPVQGLRSDGYDRICIQHKIQQKGGPYFGRNTGSTGDPLHSYVFDPVAMNQYGWPGVYYSSSGTYLVRLLVEYDHPDGTTSLPPPDPQLVNVSKELGFMRDDSNEVGGHTVSITDWNNDGYDDIAVASMFFQNNGDGTFTNVSEKFNIKASTTCWADYDNDGDQDAYAVYEGSCIQELKMVDSKNTIYRNDGNGNFTRLDPKDVFLLPYPNPAEDFNLPTPNTQDSIHNPYVCWAPLWLDYNSDGHPDLYLGNRRSCFSYPNELFNPDKLWKNNGDGTFSDVTQVSGIQGIQIHDPGNQDNIYYNGQDASACDYNMDNKIDIHMINYGLEDDLMYQNQGNETFVNKAPAIGLDGSSQFSLNPDARNHGHSVEWADFNNDAYPDVAIGNLAHPDWRGLFSTPTMIYKNLGPPDFKFKEMTFQMGLKFYESVCGVMWSDLNNDGYQDFMYVQRYGKYSHIYFNEGPPDFKLRDVSWDLWGEEREINKDIWSVARLDFDNDGDLDFVTRGRLYRNDIIEKGNWLCLRLEGNPRERVCSDAFGSRVTVFAEGRKFYRERMGAQAGPRHRQHSAELHFGLGDVVNIDSVRIDYSNGKSNLIHGLQINKKYTIPYMQTPSEINNNRILFAEPNIFTNFTVITVNLNHQDVITLSIYDEKGQFVRELFNGSQNQGLHRYTWSPNYPGQAIFICRLKTSNGSESIKLIKTK